MRAQSVILIGSGPSLNCIDPQRLAEYDTIAFNRSWLAWGDWGFAPTYHACLDSRSMAIIASELGPIVRAHAATRFFLHASAIRVGIKKSGRVTLSELAEGDSFSRSLTRLTDFGNVAATSLQILAILAYRRVLMVGVDGAYALERDSRQDPNHFRDDYAAGREPLTPADQIRYISGWPRVAAECRRLGIDVRNGSPGTALTCFPRMGFTEGLAWLKSAM